MPREHRRERGAWRIAAFRTSALRRDPLDGERPPDIEALRLRGGEAAPPGVPPAPAALVELEAIAQLKARYFRFLDGRRWGDWRRLFADDARFELEGVGGDVSTPDRFVATVRATLRRTVTVAPRPHAGARAARRAARARHVGAGRLRRLVPGLAGHPRLRQLRGGVREGRDGLADRSAAPQLPAPGRLLPRAVDAAAAAPADTGLARGGHAGGCRATRRPRRDPRAQGAVLPA